MSWGKASLIAGTVVAALSIGATVGFEKPWASKDQVDNLNSLVVGNRTLISANQAQLDLITYDRLVRKLRQEGRLEPRDLRAFCQAAERLKIRHPVCR